jgi:hypothetical protein
VLSAERLETLGGAKAIVRRHVEREMAKLTDVGRRLPPRCSCTS